MKYANRVDVALTPKKTRDASTWLKQSNILIFNHQILNTG